VGQHASKQQKFMNGSFEYFHQDSLGVLDFGNHLQHERRELLKRNLGIKTHYRGQIFEGEEMRLVVGREMIRQQGFQLIFEETFEVSPGQINVHSIGNLFVHLEIGTHLQSLNVNQLADPNYFLLVANLS
jgi:hypothetical protein